MKRNLLIILFLLLCANTLKAQNEEEEIFFVVEKSAEFPGGMNALSKYLANAIVYPLSARDNNITGKVLVSFVIEKDGTTNQVTLLHDIGHDCGHEAARAILMMPAWIPAEQHGTKLRSRFSLPINFELNNERDDHEPVSKNGDTGSEIIHLGTMPEGALIAPEYFGGDPYLIKYLHKRVGKKFHKNTTPVIISFHIDKDGNISNVKVSGDDDKLNRKYERTFAQMRPWMPAVGKQDGFYYTIPCDWSIEIMPGK